MVLPGRCGNSRHKATVTRPHCQDHQARFPSPGGPPLLPRIPVICRELGQAPSGPVTSASEPPAPVIRVPGDRPRRLRTIGAVTRSAGNLHQPGVKALPVRPRSLDACTGRGRVTWSAPSIPVTATTRPARPSATASTCLCLDTVRITDCSCRPVPWCALDWIHRRRQRTSSVVLAAPQQPTGRVHCRHQPGQPVMQHIRHSGPARKRDPGQIPQIILNNRPGAGPNASTHRRPARHGPRTCNQSGSPSGSTTSDRRLPGVFVPPERSPSGSPWEISRPAWSWA